MSTVLTAGYVPDQEPALPADPEPASVAVTFDPTIREDRRVGHFPYLAVVSRVNRDGAAPCLYCRRRVRWEREGGTQVYHRVNLDGTRHNCPQREAATAARVPGARREVVRGR